MTGTMFKTIIHHPRLTPAQQQLVRAQLDDAVRIEQRSCGGEDAYLLLHHHQAVDPRGLQALRDGLGLDVNPLPADFSAAEVRLLITDMDSTFIAIECIDEIADFAGFKSQVQAITEAAMRGELDFAASLVRRVALLKGLEVSALQQVYEQRLRLNPGAETMLGCLRQLGIRTALVSGGFTYFTERLQQRCGLDYTLANVLARDGDRLTGAVHGDIVGAEAKAAFLRQLMAEHAWQPHQVIAMGDGANDLKMLGLAGLSIAYHAKPKVREQTRAQLNHRGLETVCHFLDAG